MRRSCSTPARAVRAVAARARRAAGRCVRAVAARGHAAHLRVGRDRSTSRTCDRCGSTTTSRSRTSTSTSTTATSRAAEGFHETFLERTTETGRRVNFATIGSALLWSPFYAVADVTCAALRAAGRDVAATATRSRTSPRSRTDRRSTASLAIAAVDRRRRAGSGCGTRAALAGRRSLIWLGTPLLFYMYVAPPMSHACSAFAVALFVTVWLRVRAHVDDRAA